MQNMFGNNMPNNNWMNPLMYFGNNGMAGMNIGINFGKIYMEMG